MIMFSLLLSVLLATDMPLDFPRVPAKWHHEISSTRMADYKPDEHLITSDIITGAEGRDAVIKYMMGVRVDRWGKAFTDERENPDKTTKETLTVTLYETENRGEMKAEFDHVVYEAGKIVLRFSSTTILTRWP